MTTIKYFDSIVYSIYSDHVEVGNQDLPTPCGIEIGKTITSISLKSTVDNLKVTHVCDRAFYDVRDVQSIYIPDTILSIGNSAFDMMHFSGSLTLPSKLESIGSRAFAANSFTSIYIPASVTFIGTSAFGSNQLLTSITIDENNKHYIVTKENYIYNSMRTILIQAPYYAETISLEPTLVEIAYSAIARTKVDSITFPFPFSRMVSSGSVVNCPNLETVTFQGNLLYIVPNAFSNCPKLANIFYYGTISVDELFIDTSANVLNNIRLCEGYKGTSFGGYTNGIIKQGPCFPLSLVKVITCKIRPLSFRLFALYILILI